MTEKMTDAEASDVATRLIAAGVEDNFKVQYWLTLLFATGAVVTAPVVTICSAYYYFFSGVDLPWKWEEFGSTLAFAWSAVVLTTFVHWRVRSVGKRAGVTMRF
jgi:hypothetical protein